MGLGTMTTSCEDMLSPDSERHSYEIAQDTLYSYWGIVKSLQNVAERYTVLGDCRGDLVTSTSYVSDSITAILNFDMEKSKDGSNRFLKATDYYHIINSCNAYLASYDKDRYTANRDPYMKKEAAQVEAIRAWVYLQLVQVYGRVPFYTTPLLTTDDINSFMTKEHQMVDVTNIATLLCPGLIELEQIERHYGFPQYDEYGFQKLICHSSKVMIPLNIIIADLYLTQGEYANAAQYYYNYLSCNAGDGTIVPGGALVSGNVFSGEKTSPTDPATYKFDLYDVLNTGRQTRNIEAITAIPSSKNKLWGTVLRGVNELYGFDASIIDRSDNDTTSNADVALVPLYNKKQLFASGAYEALCKAQQYEIYVGSSFNDARLAGPQVYPEIGDARYYWVQDWRQTYSDGLTSNEKFVTKQNPGGSHSAVFPMIYHKSMIWLRYAEALNRAGYPSYAFAILKNGLCNNEDWYPEVGTVDYAVKSAAYHYTYAETLNAGTADEITIEHIVPGAEDMTITSVDDLLTAVRTEMGDDTYELVEANIQKKVLDYENWPADDCSKVLYYLDARERQAAPAFLNFNEISTLNGNYSSISVPWRMSLAEGLEYSGLDPFNSKKNLTIGIHARGCGVLCSDEKSSVYNYVDQVIAKASENYGVTLTKEDIYNGSFDDVVKNCVEDLIVDEMALELAFEGTRFFDLMRVSDHRGDPTYLAKKVAKRSGTTDSAMESKLSNRNNWFFPLPNN